MRVSFCDNVVELSETMFVHIAQNSLSSVDETTHFAQKMLVDGNGNMRTLPVHSYFYLLI